MHPVSSSFLTALRQPSMTAAASVATGTGVPIAVPAGRVDMDSRRSIVRTCDLDLGPTADLTLADVYDLVMTPGVELTVRRGLLVNGAPEYVPLGVFATDTATWPQRRSSTIRWSGSDRSKRIARARFTDAYPISAGTTLAAAATSLLKSRWSAVPVDFSNVTEVLSAALTFDAGPESDPWKEITALFSDHGYDLAFDGAGVCRAKPVPDPATMGASFDFGSGDTNLITDGDLEGTFEFTYNGAIVTGEGTALATPVRAEAWDDDPASPTYSQGGFGRIPYFYSSPVLTTQAMAATAARTILARVTGHRETRQATAVVNPALEPLDLVTITDDTGTSRVVLDKLVIPLSADEPMTFTGRETSVA